MSHLLSWDACDLYSMTIILDSLLHIIIVCIYVKFFIRGSLRALQELDYFFLIVSLYKNRFHVLTPLLDSVVEAVFF